MKDSDKWLYANPALAIAGLVIGYTKDHIDDQGRGLVLNDKNFLDGYHIINIDCGMALRNRSSRLACLRLEDEQVFYESLEQ